MKNLIEALDFLAKTFSSTTWPIGLNREKLRARSRIGTDPSYPDYVIIEIERHRAILGTSYIEGCPMEAFETYVMRYAVSAVADRVVELPEEHIAYTFNPASLVENCLSSDLFELVVEAIDEERFEIREQICREKAEIRTVDDAIEFALSIEDMISDYFFMIFDLTLKDCPELDDALRQQFAEEFTERLRYGLAERAKAAWDDREPFEQSIS